MRPAWQMSASEYQAMRGVHQPHIAEIAPSQYARLSRRARATYDRKRAAEWDASEACKREWRDAVLAAVGSGEYDELTASEDARSVVFHARLKEKKQRAAEELEQLLVANRDVSLDVVKVGDRVFDLMGGHYAVVVRKNRTTIRLRAEETTGYMAGREWNAHPSRLQWKSYVDAIRSES